MDNQTIEIETENNYIIPIWREILWSLLFAVIPVVGATGNFIVVWIVMAHKNMRSVTNIFIVNLAFADGLVALIDVPVVAYELIYSDWQFGLSYCKLNEALASINICVSMLMMSMISIDRYIAIMYPFRRRIKKQTTILITVLIWCISLVVTCPNWIYATVGIRNNTTEDKVKYFCSQEWPDDDIELIYRIGFMSTTFILPFICMTYTYSRMGLKLWGAKRIGEQTRNHIKNMQSKKRIVKMLLIVVITFSLCWLPFQLLFLLTSSGVVTNLPVYFREIYLLTFWFAMSNTMYNPIIYCWLNAKFRAGFKRALKCCPFIEYDDARYQVHFRRSYARGSSFEVE